MLTGCGSTLFLCPIFFLFDKEWIQLGMKHMEGEKTGLHPLLDDLKKLMLVMLLVYTVVLYSNLVVLSL
jgi:hypothetical protein